MVTPAAPAIDLSALIDDHAEWLVISENGKTFPINRTEIEVIEDKGKQLFGFLNDKGFRFVRVEKMSAEGGEFVLEVRASLARETETIRLVPRISAAELSANVEIARLQKANEIAAAISAHDPNLKLVRVALNKGSGRFAEITVKDRAGVHIAILSDVSERTTPETLLTTAILWLARLQMRRKNPIDEIWIAGEKKIARNLQKLHALLERPIKTQIKIFEIGKEKLKRLPALDVRAVWHGKAKKLVLPTDIEPCETAQRIVLFSPENIDVMFSKNGESLRFHGLLFARVRKMAGRESAWFGVERTKRSLGTDTQSDFEQLIENLETYRSFETASKRHELYRLAPESWLESILRRNIKLLDANLILAPIYNQFRTFADKIDLLALRKDGRLVIIEIKASPDREMPFQAADYWRKIEHLRRRGELKRAKVFGDLEILDAPALVYAVAPALSFHRDFEYFAKMLSKKIELWRFELHENWREEIKVIARKNYWE
ncbi:MAG: hypothetical protein ABIU09_03185 [Pyrinomonadaceae bacterium]